MSVTRDQMGSVVDKHFWDEIEKLKKKVDNLERHITVDEHGWLRDVSSELIEKIGEEIARRVRR